MQSIFKPANLEKADTELLTLAESHLHEEVMQAMVDHLEMMTRSKEKMARNIGRSSSFSPTAKL